MPSSADLKLSMPSGGGGGGSDQDDGGSSSDVRRRRTGGSKSGGGGNGGGGSSVRPMETVAILQQQDDDDGCSCCTFILLILSYIGIVVLFPLTICKMVVQVMQYQRAVVFRFGKINGGAKGPGILIINPFLDQVEIVDLRTLSFNVPPQEILSKDSVTVKVDAVVYYSIHDPILSVTNVKDANTSTNLLACTTLRNVLGTKSLSEILTDRENIAERVLSHLDECTDPWGIKVSRVEVKDVSLPPSMQRAMAAEAEATREARAKIIAAEGEMKASEALKLASDVISTSNAALQLRYLQTLTHLSAEKNSTIIFPVPVDMLSQFMENKKDK